MRTTADNKIGDNWSVTTVAKLDTRDRSVHSSARTRIKDDEMIDCVAVRKALAVSAMIAPSLVQFRPVSSG